MFTTLLGLLILTLPGWAEEPCVDGAGPKVDPLLEKNLNVFLQALPPLGSRIDTPRSCLESIEESVPGKLGEMEKVENAFDRILRPAREMEKPSQALFDRAAETLTCQQIDDLRFHFAFALSRISALTALKPFFTTKKTKSLEYLLGRAHCLVTCQKKNKSGCEDSCHVDESVMDQLENGFLSGKMLEPNCSDDFFYVPTEAELHDLAVKFAQVEDNISSHLNSVRHSRQARFTEIYNSLVKETELLGPKVKKLQGKQCGMEIAAAAAGPQSVRLLLLSAGAQGSGFYAQAPDGKTFLATARHVSFAGASLYNLLSTSAIDNHTVFHNFEVSPGNYHAGNDATITPADKRKSGLPLVPSGNRPEIGQNLLLTGYPAAVGGAFTTTRCKFAGYGPGNQTDTMYYLSCAASDLSGNSGGALVDDKGRVWGITSAQSEPNGTVAVSPISFGEKGEVGVGFSGVSLSDHCYESLGHISAPHRCQIFPGSRETQQP